MGEEWWLVASIEGIPQTEALNLVNNSFQCHWNWWRGNGKTEEPSVFLFFFLNYWLFLSFFECAIQEGEGGMEGQGLVRLECMVWLFQRINVLKNGDKWLVTMTRRSSFLNLGIGYQGSRDSLIAHSQYFKMKAWSIWEYT